jgi:ring-1,2-phenylacetyl-CoA epoxidase subunit PaaD
VSRVVSLDTGRDMAALWALLDEVPDPEVPALSVRDLGVVRDIEKDAEGALRLKVTPTYSGCPATAAINMAIRDRFLQEGFERIEIETVLSPAWTTDWISAEGREKLRAYGIAPPEKGGDRGALFGGDPEVPCPRCGATTTEKVSEFGSTACKAQYRCTSCLEPFEYFKCI